MAVKPDQGNNYLKFGVPVWMLIILGYMLISSMSLPSISIFKKGLYNAEWKKIPGGILVWSNAKNNFQADVYDDHLQSIASYSKSIKNFSVDNVSLFHEGSSCIEFLFHDKSRNQNMFLRLDLNLKELFVSPPYFKLKAQKSDSVFYLSPKHLETALSSLRINNTLFEIRNDSIKGRNGEAEANIVLRLSKELRTETLPVFQKIWDYKISITVPEYSKIIFADHEKVYFYINSNTRAGEQFVYCIDIKSGSLIYKTKLSIIGTTACLYSNYYYNRENHNIILGGTCILDPEENETTGYSGIFIMQLNPNGVVTGTYARQAQYLAYPQQQQRDGTPFGFSRNEQTYSRFVAFNQRPDGLMSVILESYSKIYKNIKVPDNKHRQLLDNDYHFLIIESVCFEITQSSIKPFCPNCVDDHVVYFNNPHLDSISGFLQKETRMADIHYPDDINHLIDPTWGDVYYLGSEFVNNADSTKVLIKYKIEHAAGASDIYFSKTCISKKNFNAYLSPTPVSGQRFATPSKFLICDSSTLFKLTTTNDGYSIALIEW